MLEITVLNKELTVKNLDALKDIDRESIQKYGDLFSSEEWCEKEFLLDLHGKWELSCIGFINNNPVAFCISPFFNSNKCFDCRVVVSERCKGVHIGNERFKFLFKKCLEKKITQIILEVNIENKSAIKFYEKQYFKKIKRGNLMQYLIKKEKIS